MVLEDTQDVFDPLFLPLSCPSPDLIPHFPSPVQCLSPSYLPLRCMAGGCGRLLRGPESCSLGCAQATQCALCLRRPHCGWCAWGGQDGGGRCLEGGLSGPRDGELGWGVVRGVAPALGSGTENLGGAGGCLGGGVQGR